MQDGAVFMQYCTGILLVAAFLFFCCRAFLVRKLRKRLDKVYFYFPVKPAVHEEPFEYPVCVLRGDGACCLNVTSRQHIKHSNESIRVFDGAADNPFEDRFEIHFRKRN